MSIRAIIIFIIFIVFVQSTLAQEILEECQGEGCGCFQGYMKAKVEKKPINFELVTIRPFKLFEKPDFSSRLIGEFKAGIKAKPLGPRTVIVEQGEYIVEQVNDPQVSLKPKDIIHSVLYLDEAMNMKARKGSVWIGFSDSLVKLRKIKETKVIQWLKVETKGHKGYTTDSPFEMCLE